jgi:glycosyltransferase involved in cell wall biosynthesis
MFPNPFTETEWMQSNHPILLEIAKELGSLGCDCVPTPKHPSLLWMMSNRRHIDVIHLQWPEQYYWPTMYSRLARLLSPVAHRWNLQGIVRFLYLAWVFAFVSLAKLFKLPIVWTLHDLYPHGQTSDEHYRAEHLARAYLMRNISVLILNCGSAEPLVTAEFGRPNSIVVAPLGDYRKFYPDTVSADVARHAMGVMEHDIVFLYVGTMRTHRNPLRLIQAFRDMPQKNLRLFVVGETWDDLRREMEKASWGDWRIRCLFQLAPNDQMEFLLKACDFVVMPGEYYLSSAVVMLALSFARPVIAPRYGCAADMVGGAGILYDYQNELALADALGKAVRADQQKCKRLAEARARSFSWSLTAARTLEAYRIALGVKPASLP